MLTSPIRGIRRLRTSLTTNIYITAILNDLGVMRARRPRNGYTADEDGEVKPPVEALQVSVLVAMPSLERKLRAKLRRESLASTANVNVKGKERVSVDDEDDGDPPREIGTQFGELVIGTSQIPWEEETLGV